MQAYHATEPCDSRLTLYIERRGREANAFNCKVPWLERLDGSLTGFTWEVGDRIRRPTHRPVFPSSGGAEAALHHCRGEAAQPSCYQCQSAARHVVHTCDAIVKLHIAVLCCSAIKDAATQSGTGNKAVSFSRRRHKDRRANLVCLHSSIESLLLCVAPFTAAAKRGCFFWVQYSSLSCVALRCARVLRFHR